DPARWSPVARVVASQIPALSARARRITACDSRESSKSICKEIALQQPKAGKFDYLSAPGHSAHSMASEFFTDDYLVCMLQRTLPAGFIAPGLPTRPISSPQAANGCHEIKHDGSRIIARKNDAQVRL